MVASAVDIFGIIRSGSVGSGLVYRSVPACRGAGRNPNRLTACGVHALCDHSRLRY
jgi:hypothetical protein